MNRHPDKRSVHLGVALVAVVLFLSGPVAPEASPPDQAAASYIVQATDMAAATAAVLRSGGEITHRLAVIDGVGARLTASQRRLLESDRSLRLVADRTARVASCSGLSGELVELKDDKLEWAITNSSGRALTVDAVALGWPAENARLEKLKLAGKELVETQLAPPSATLSGGWEATREERVVGAGEVAVLELQFESDALIHQPAYSIRVVFAEGCVVEFTPRGDTCEVAGWGYRELKDEKIKWEVYNSGSTPATLSGISLNWPAANGDLVEVKLEGSALFAGSRPGPVVGFHEFPETDLEDRRIDAGDEAKIELEFESDVDRDQEKYTITLDFIQGCTVRFSPVSGDTDYDKKARSTPYPAQVGADLLQDEGILGRGITVAVIDTGLWNKNGGEKWLSRNNRSDGRLAAAYDATTDTILDPRDLEDPSGHGSHVTSILASSRKTSRSGGSGTRYNGIAPGADLVIVRAFDESGNGSYLDIVRGIQFVIDHKDTYGIRVLNLSFSGVPRSFYWDDPLAQATMAAWRAGIVVVASAGNTGPEAMTVGVPGNVPYIITVGAMTDSYTPAEPSDDRLTVFSSAGPTFEGFVKPDLIAPGGHMLGLMNKESLLPKKHKEFHDSEEYFVMSGTSQATAVVSGLVALLLEAEPALTPDEVKCRLLATARPATDNSGKPVYSVFQQGAGLVDGAAALLSSASACANRGLDLGADLAGSEHFGGRAALRDDGTFHLRDLEGEGLTWADGFIWSDHSAANDGFIWADALAWNDGFVWADALAWGDGFVWADTCVVSTNTWVEQE